MFFGHKKEKIKQSISTPAGVNNTSSTDKEMLSRMHIMPEIIVTKTFNPFTSKFWFLSIGSIILISIIGYLSIFFIPSLSKNRAKKGLNNNIVNTSSTTTPIIIATTTPAQPIIKEPIQTIVPIEASTTSVPIIPVDVASIDTDQDGLSNTEEELYGGNLNMSDTDGDTYPDGLEIENLYSITNGPSNLLIDSNTIKIYTNNTYKYSIYYPSSWVQNVVNNIDNEVRFVSNTGEFIEVLAQDNPKQLSVTDWYKEQVVDSNIILKQIETNGLKGVVTEDGLITYLASNNDLSKIYGLIYNIGNKTNLDFPVTYKMMLKSFTINF